MSGGSIGRRTTLAHKLLLCAILATASVMGLATSASARTRHFHATIHARPHNHASGHPTHPGAHAGPQVLPRNAMFVIPSTSTVGTSWTLNLWRGGQLIGSATGTTGVLTVTVPRTVAGTVQADVRRNGRWYSGTRVALPGRGTGGKGGGGHPGGGHGSPGGGHGNPGGGKSPGGSTSPGSTSPGGDTTAGNPPGGTSPVAGNTGTNGSGNTVIPFAVKAPSTAAAGSAAVNRALGLPGSGRDDSHGPLHPATTGSGSHSPTTVPAADLSFTGPGGVFWSSGLAGLGVLLLGGYLLIRRRARTRQA